MPRAPRGPSLRLVRWANAWRIIASRFPPILLFERLSSDPEVQEALIALEQLTNPRLRDEIGEIALVPPHRRISGPNASWVMASFTHLNPKGSRFSDGSYGVYYCADSMETAIAEAIHHFEAFARDSHDPPRSEDMRVFKGPLNHRFHDVTTVSQKRLSAIMRRNDYNMSRPFGRELRESSSDGVVYPSVRRKGGECVGAFWPDVVGLPTQDRHLKYHWDGARVSRYFDYQENAWVEV
jgi:hypothetical protein